MTYSVFSGTLNLALLIYLTYMKASRPGEKLVWGWKDQNTNYSSYGKVSVSAPNWVQGGVKSMSVFIKPKVDLF